MIKLIAMDMDGTLLNDDHATISQRNLDALHAAAEQGIEVVIASGRTWSLLEDIARNVGVVRYVLISNGAAILDLKTGEWLLQVGMPEQQVLDFIRVLDEHNTPFELFCDGTAYMERQYLERAMGHALSPDYAKLFRSRMTLVDDLAPVIAGRTVEKIHVFHVEPEERGMLTKALQAVGPFESACAYATNMEITSPDADKGAALSVLCQKLGIDASEVMAFGDADNDLGMLSWAGWSFAMGNGTAKAKAAAKHIADTNSASGVAQAVEAYALGRQP